MVRLVKLRIDDDCVFSENYGIDSVNLHSEYLEFIDPIFIHYREMCERYFLEKTPSESLEDSGYFICWDTPFGICVWDPNRVPISVVEDLFKKCIDSAILHNKSSCINQFNIEIRRVKIKMLLV